MGEDVASTSQNGWKEPSVTAPPERIWENADETMEQQGKTDESTIGNNDPSEIDLHTALKHKTDSGVSFKNGTPPQVPKRL